MADTPIEQKAQINTKQREYFMNLPKMNPNTPVPRAGVAGMKGMANVAAKFADTLGTMQDRNDKIANTAFDQKRASMEKTLALQVGSANTLEDVDKIYNQYKQDLNGVAKEMLKGRPYDNWNNSESSNYYNIMQDTMDRAKAPILQREGDIFVTQLMEDAAKDRALATTDEERAQIDYVVKQTVDYATYPKDGSMPIYDSTKGTQKIKWYLNKADEVAVAEDAQVDAKTTMNNLNSGKYKNLSAEQIADAKPKVQRLVDKQEQEDLYSYAVQKFVDPKSGKTDMTKVVSYLNTQAEKETGVKATNAKVAADMAISRLNRDEQLQTAADRKNLEGVYDGAFKRYMAGDTESAIQYVTDSSIPWDDKYKLIQNFKEGKGSSAGGGSIKSNPQTYSDLAQRIVNEEIYDALPIVQEFAKQNLSEKDKDDLIQLIGQVQQPSGKQYTRAMKQVDNAIKSGLFGYKQVDSDTKAYISGKLTQEYRNAVKQGKSLEEVENMFNPTRVNAMIAQGVDEYPNIKADMEAQMAEDKKIAEGTVKIQQAYNTLQTAITKRQIKTPAELKASIEEVEKENSYYNTVDAQFALEDLLNKYNEYDSVPKWEAPKAKENLILTSAAQAEAVAKQTIGKPVLTFSGTAALPGEDIQAYTNRIKQGIIK